MGEAAHGRRACGRGVALKQANRRAGGGYPPVAGPICAICFSLSARMKSGNGMKPIAIEIFRRIAALERNCPEQEMAQRIRGFAIGLA